MSYPHAVATGNEVIAAAVALHDANNAWGHAAMHGSETEADTAERAYFGAVDRLDEAVAAHRAASALPHVQGPDIDVAS